jgi:hypothetical protein
LPRSRESFYAMWRKATGSESNFRHAAVAPGLSTKRQE